MHEFTLVTMIKVNDALHMLEQTDVSGKHIPLSVKFATWNKEKHRAGKLHSWPLAHATGHRHKNATDTISIMNAQTGETRTVNTWLIFELKGQLVIL